MSRKNHLLHIAHTFTLLNQEIIILRTIFLVSLALFNSLSRLSAEWKQMVHDFIKKLNMFEIINAIRPRSFYKIEEKIVSRSNSVNDACFSI